MPKNDQISVNDFLVPNVRKPIEARPIESKFEKSISLIGTLVRVDNSGSERPEIIVDVGEGELRSLTINAPFCKIEGGVLKDEKSGYHTVFPKSGGDSSIPPKKSRTDSTPRKNKKSNK